MQLFTDAYLADLERHSYVVEKGELSRLLRIIQDAITPGGIGVDPVGVNVCGSITLGTVGINPNYGKMEIANNDVGAGGSINFLNVAANDYAGRIYSASDDFLVLNSTSGYRLSNNLPIKLERLAGTGTRTVVADADGFLSAP